MAEVELTNAMIGKYVDFHKDNWDYSGVIDGIKWDQFVISMIDDFENEIEVLVPADNITYVHHD